MRWVLLLPFHFITHYGGTATLPSLSHSLCFLLPPSLSVSLLVCLPLSVTLQHSESVAVCLWSNYCICCPFFASLPACLTAGVVLPPSPDTPPLLSSPSSHSAAPPQPLLIWLPSLFRHSSCRRARSCFGSHFQLPKLLHLLLLPLLCCSPTAPLLSPLLPLHCYFYCRSSSTSLLVCVSIWRICFALLAFLFNVD